LISVKQSFHKKSKLELCFQTEAKNMFLKLIKNDENQNKNNIIILLENSLYILI
jgi:hypothetical protein